MCPLPPGSPSPFLLLPLCLQVPIGDNYFTALNSAVFSDGSFVYVPKGVKSPMELSTYFRINASETGQVRRCGRCVNGVWKAWTCTEEPDTAVHHIFRLSVRSSLQGRAHGSAHVS